MEQLSNRGAHRCGHLPLAAGVHHHVRDAAHEVLAEPDLRVHRAGRCDDLAGREVAQVRCDGRRADVHRGPVHFVPEAGPYRDDVALAVHRDGDAPIAGAQRRLEGLDHLEAAMQVLEPPLLLERRLDTSQIAGRLVHVGRRDLDIAQPYYGIDVDRVDLGALAHHLPVDLAVWRDVDHDVSVDSGRTAEATPGSEGRSLLVVAALDRPELGQMFGPGTHAVLGELPDALHNLAAPADAPSAAHRVEIHPKRPRRVEDRRPDGETPPAPRWREDDPCIAGPCVAGSCIAGPRVAGPGVFSHGGGGGGHWCAGRAPLRCRASEAHGTSRSTACNPGRVPS